MTDGSGGERSATLARGTRLGPYEIVSLLGAGGMGEVYRARDTRLSRDVALKILPQVADEDSGRFRRFQTEAKSAAALSHPNIVAVYDIGQEGRTAYIVSELVAGGTLTALLERGPLPARKLLDLAIPMAEALAAAHASGIVHRDLKPDNVLLGADGAPKISDFGLAKYFQPTPAEGSLGTTLPDDRTREGMIVGTVGYMSPEQAQSQPVDFRSDQFSFGSVLYEMATSTRAFRKKSVIDTLAAIINEDPSPIVAANPRIPAPLRWIIERCHRKDPDGRYASTTDLARELASVREHLSEASGGGESPQPARHSRFRPALFALGIASLLVASYFVGTLRSRIPPVPHFQKVTFRQGTLWRARFAPDGETIVYAMAGIGDDLKPAQMFAARVGDLATRPLGLSSADIFSISSSGRLAVGLADDPLTIDVGTLAEVSLVGGTTPRPILDGVRDADWSPDGKSLAAVVVTGAKNRLEYPIGTVLYETMDEIDDARVSPDGATVAFTEWREGGNIRVVDRRGVVRTLVEHADGNPACWSPRGDELWWTTAIYAFGIPLQGSEVHAVTLKGQTRIVTSLPGEFVLRDLSGSGRMLVEQVHRSYAMRGTFPGDTADRNLAWLDQSLPASLSPDGQMLLFQDRGDAAGTKAGTYVRRIDGSSAVLLGEGNAGLFSPDGKWTLICRKTPHHLLYLIPTGPGRERNLPTGNVVANGMLAFHPDGKRVFFSGVEPGHDARAWEMSIDGGSPKPVTPEGMPLVLLSPNGMQLVARGDADRDLMIYPTNPSAKTAPRQVALTSRHEIPLHWTADGGALLIADNATRPIRVDRLDLATGRRSPWRTFSPAGFLGGGTLSDLVFSANDDAWVAGYVRRSSELLVIDGLN